MPIFVPPALYYGGVAALGAGARFLNSPTGQNVIRSGQNLFSRGLTGLQNYANPLINRAFGTQMGVPIQQQVVPGASKAIPPTFIDPNMPKFTSPSCPNSSQLLTCPCNAACNVKSDKFNPTYSDAN